MFMKKLLYCRLLTNTHFRLWVSRGLLTADAGSCTAPTILPLGFITYKRSYRRQEYETKTIISL
jgi:hypothetical protein